MGNKFWWTCGKGSWVRENSPFFTRKPRYQCRKRTETVHGSLWNISRDLGSEIWKALAVSNHSAIEVIVMIIMFITVFSCGCICLSSMFVFVFLFLLRVVCCLLLMMICCCCWCCSYCTAVGPRVQATLLPFDGAEALLLRCLCWRARCTLDKTWATCNDIPTWRIGRWRDFLKTFIFHPNKSMGSPGNAKPAGYKQQIP